MKEFLEKSGVNYLAINVDADQAARDKLERLNMLLPATCIGDDCVNGMDLAGVAKLIGVEYTPRIMLSPEKLVVRYRENQDAGCRFIAQMTPEMLASGLEGRERDMTEVAYQVAMVARSFLSAYYDDRHDIQFYIKPEGVAERSDELLKLAAETRILVDQWWDEDGIDDPLERVTETYWGHPTLHEVLEREVWHTTQHARQLQYVLERFGVEPDRPLTEAQLAGLPLPERVHG
jgi:hypothetical protein